MNENIKCPHWDEKKGKCKLMPTRHNEVNQLMDIIHQLYEIIDGYAPPKTSLGPVPGSHGQIEGSSPIQMAPVQAPPPPPFLSFLGGSPDDKKRPIWGQEEDSKKKQEYWEKELKKMDEKEKK